MFDTRAVHYNRLLDLTDPAVRQSIGLTFEQITIEDTKPFAYEVTHQLGFLAKKYGFDAIKFPSAAMEAKNMKGINIVRLIR